MSAAVLLHHVPVADDPAATAVPGASRAGRHRRVITAADRLGRAVDVVARFGSLVALAAALVVAATAGGLVDGTPVTGDAAVTVTFDGTGR